MTAPPFFPGQPGDPYNDPQADTSLWALFNAFDALRAAAVFGDDPGEEAIVGEALQAAEMVKFGFDPATDEARGLHLLIGAVRRKAAGMPS